ncbi:MAG: hypothetical protein U9N80_15695 [Chloroflexota bacterium]|nr:hypothetical protein [Chloroflexota bacterium]
MLLQPIHAKSLDLGNVLPSQMMLDQTLPEGVQVDVILDEVQRCLFAVFPLDDRELDEGGRLAVMVGDVVAQASPLWLGVIVCSFYCLFSKGLDSLLHSSIPFTINCNFFYLYQFS